jgi:hypothetical protein
MIEKNQVFHPQELVLEPNHDIYKSGNTFNEKLLMIVNKNSGLAPFTHEFVEGNQDPQVLSGFISAMSSFMGEITGDTQTQWKTAYGSNSILLVEGGEWSTGVLAASRETSEARSKLRRVVREFEECFEFLKDAEGTHQSIFREFHHYVRREFVDERVTGRTVVMKNPAWRESMAKLDLPSEAFRISKVLLSFKEDTTVNEISEFHKLRLEEVIDIVSRACWHGMVNLKYVPCDDDILALSDKTSSFLFDKRNPMNLSSSSLSVIARLNGRKPLSYFLNDMIIQDLDLILSTLGTLVNKGFIQRISVEKRLVLLNECTLSKLVSKGANIIGRRKMKHDFESIRKRGVMSHPWVGRIILEDGMRVRSILEESMTPVDLDDMYDALDYFIKEMNECLSKRCGNRIAEMLLLKVRSQCNQAWTPYLSNVVI